MAAAFLFLFDVILYKGLKKYEEDLALIKALKRGEPKAFEYVFEEFYEALCAYANKIVGSVEVSEDLVHNVFCSLWIKRKDLNLNRSVKSYLFQSVYNAALNHLQRQKVERKYIQERFAEYVKEELVLFPYGEDNHQEKLMKEQLMQAVEKLPIKCRNILKMSRFSGLKNKEIAEELGVSINTVQSQIAIALNKLRKHFRQ